MTAALFRQLILKVWTLDGLDQLMIRYWPDVIATEAESDELLGLVLSRQIELATAPCEFGTTGEIGRSPIQVLDMPDSQFK